MSVFTPFRTKTMVRTVLATGGALKLAHMLNEPVPGWIITGVHAQQNQSVNIAAVGGSSATWVPYRCDDSTGIQSTVISISSTQGQIVSGTNGSVLYVCGFTMTGNDTTLSVKFVTGTSTDCITGEADRTGAMRLSVFAPISVSNGGGVQFMVSSGLSLCADVVSSGAIGGFMTYKQST